MSSPENKNKNIEARIKEFVSEGKSFADRAIINDYGSIPLEFAEGMLTNQVAGEWAKKFDEIFNEKISAISKDVKDGVYSDDEGMFIVRRVMWERDRIAISLIRDVGAAQDRKEKLGPAPSLDVVTELRLEESIEDAVNHWSNICDKLKLAKEFTIGAFKEIGRIACDAVGITALVSFVKNLTSPKV